MSIFPRLATIGLFTVGNTCANGALAAAEFTAVTRNESSGARLPTPAIGNSTVRGDVDGDRGRIEYVESGVGGPLKGSVIVTTDGAQTTRLYNPQDETCATMARQSAGMRASASALTRYDHVAVEKALDEAGPKTHGLATRHLRYKVAYEVHSADRNAKPVHGSMDFEVWIAPALSDPAYALWLEAAPHTGNPDADRTLAAGMPEAKGAALKRIQHTWLQVEGRPEMKATSTLEVTKLSTRKLGEKALDPPFTCRTGTSRD
jgi:hypothetical protein